MKKTRVEFRPSIEDHSLESVTTIHNESSDMAADVDKFTVREWLWDFLENPVEEGDIDGSNFHGGYGFIGKFGLNNLQILARVQEEMLGEELLLRFSLRDEEKDEWSTYWIRSKGGDNVKLKVTETFRYEGKEYKPEDSPVDLPDPVAKSVIEKGYGEEEESPEVEAGEEAPEVEIEAGEEEEEGFPEVEGPTGGESEEEIMDQLDEDLDKAGELPQKWNASTQDGKEVTDQPPVNPLKGKIVMKDIGTFKYGKSPFVVIRTSDGDEYTVFNQTALRQFIYTAFELSDKELWAAVSFEGIEKKEGGQNYLNYKSALRTREDGRVYLKSPEEDEWWEED